MSSLWPRFGIWRVARAYRKSFAQFEVMKREAPERVLAFSLDQYREEGLPYLEQALLAPLGLDLDERVAARIEEAGVVNSAGHHGVKRRRSLTRREQRFLDRNPDLVKAEQDLRWDRG